MSYRGPHTPTSPSNHQHAPCHYTWVVLHMNGAVSSSVSFIQYESEMFTLSGESAAPLTPGGFPVSTKSVHLPVRCAPREDTGTASSFQLLKQSRCGRSDPSLDAHTVISLWEVSTSRLTKPCHRHMKSFLSSIF